MPTPIGKKKFVKQPKQQTRWKYEGCGKAASGAEWRQHTSLDSDTVKQAKKKERQELGLACKYVRGLRVFAKDPETTKFVDRDVNGSINDVGSATTSRGGNALQCSSGQRSQSCPFEHIIVAPRSKQRVRVEKDHTKNPEKSKMVSQLRNGWV